MRSLSHTNVTPAMFQQTEMRSFDRLEQDHLAQLERERIGRNESQLRYVERLLVEQGLTDQADELLAFRNDCAVKGTDVGGDRRIQQLLDSLKYIITDQNLQLKISDPYKDLSDLINRHNWNRFRSCWNFWDNIVSILDHRLISINITGRPDRTIVEFKEELDGLRDRVVAALRPLANWYSWHLDVSLMGASRHPHYHCLFVVPATMDRAVFDAVDDLKKHAFRNDDGLYVRYRDWQDYDRRRPMLDVAGRQRSWIAALAYATRLISHRPLPRGEYAPTLSSFLDVDDHVGQIRQEWDAALQEVLKRTDLYKAVGARRMALFLRKEAGRQVVSFRQSKRWKSFEPASRPGTGPSAPLTSPAGTVDGDSEGDANLLLGILEAAAPPYRACVPDVSEAGVEQCSETASEKMEQKDLPSEAKPVPYDDSKPSMVIHKGFKENLEVRPRGRPRREINHQELMLAIIDGGTCTATAAILQTSTRKVREEMSGAGIEPFSRGRPPKLGTRSI